MQIELIEIRDHLNRFAPFDELPEETLNEIARQTQVGYFKAGSEILAFGAPIHELHYVRSGAVLPADTEAAPFFAFLAKLAADHGLTGLSMGMSGDYETAVMLGATHVRVGSALFGGRG